MLVDFLFDFCFVFLGQSMDRNDVFQQADADLAGDTADVEPVKDLADLRIRLHYILNGHVAKIVFEFHLCTSPLVMFLPYPLHREILMTWVKFCESFGKLLYYDRIELLNRTAKGTVGTVMKEWKMLKTRFRRGGQGTDEDQKRELDGPIRRPVQLPILQNCEALG
jgi:hypothetical protein